MGGRRTGDACTGRTGGPVITVITPLHNAAPFIAEAVRSVLAQSCGDFEHVLVDDGSTDGSAEIVAAFDDARIVLVRKAHEGSAAAYNACLERARGEFIAVLDHDDVMHPERLERQQRFLETHPSVDIVGTSHRIIDEEGRVVGMHTAPTGAARVHDLQQVFNAVAHQTVMMRRTVLQLRPWYRDDCVPAHDTEWLTRASQTHAMDNLVECLTDWRRRAGSPTGSRNAEQMRIHHAVRRGIQRATLAAAGTDAERALCLTRLGRIEYYDGHGGRALRCFVAAARITGLSGMLVRHILGCLLYPAVLLARRTGVAAAVNRRLRSRDREGRYFAQ